ncbi:CAP domain-containing protein [Amaricoccus solimangrovi]|nr:CAP domain-containing protein [Amaricoccus solimangrovi]
MGTTRAASWGLIPVLALLAGMAGATETRIPPDDLLAPVSWSAPDQARFAEAVLLYSNAAREARGIPPLRADPALALAASNQAGNMEALRTLSHRLPIPGAVTYRDRLRALGIPYTRAAENIALGKLYRLLGRPISRRSQGCAFTYGDTGAPVPIHSYASLAQEVVARWLASPGHRASLLSPRYTRVGAGLGVDPTGAGCGDVYMAQAFAG